LSKKLTVGLAIVCLLSLGGSAFAELDTIDVVPAATLLLPYFEVDLGGGITTLFSINNASAAATIAHVTLWTNESVPTLDFDVYLTGFDVQTISLSEIFISGNLPITADLIRDPGDTADPNDGISNFGALSLPVFGDATFPGCAANLPLPAGFLNDGFLLPYIQAAHTGNLVNGQGLIPSGCYGFNLGDQIARGYITVDDTNDCSLLFPNAAAYFAEGGLGVASNDNQLWGDYFIVDVAESFAFGDNLVHVEAESILNEYGPGDYTFYGRYVSAGPWLGVDGREPLASVWAVRYLEGGGFTAGTDLLVWRDSKAASAVQANCAVNQIWYPLGQNQAVAFDERENPVELCRIGGSRVSPPTNQQQTCFPLETQRVPARGPSLVGAALNVPFDFGWLYLNLNTSVPLGIAPLAALPPTQSHVTTNMSASGAFSVGFSGTVLVHTSDGLDPILAPVPITAPCPGPSCP
jgi:hypothetical protein